MDWGLLDSNAGENRFLREEVVYSSAVSKITNNNVQLQKETSYITRVFQNFYYFAIIEDFILRFIWIASFVLVECGYISSDLMTSVVAPLEVFR